MHNLTLGRVYETTHVVERQKVLHISVYVWTGVGTQTRACACARVALIIQHATLRRIVICGLSGSATFFDIISYTARFFEKKITDHKMFVFIFSTTFI